MSHLIDLAIGIATQAHSGQLDKQNQPYILHPLRVGSAGKTLGEQIVGFLHDTVEDTSLNLGMIENHFDSEIAQAVASVTRGWRHNGFLFFKRPMMQDAVRECYDAFIHRALQNQIGRGVKVYDIQDNLARIEGLSPHDRLRLESKYIAALRVLRGSELKKFGRMCGD